LGEGRVLLELLLDLAKDALFILGEWHPLIIARSDPILNAAGNIWERIVKPVNTKDSIVT